VATAPISASGSRQPIGWEYQNMLRLVRVAALFTLGLGLSSYARAASEELDKIDPVMGYWEGEWSDEISGSQGFCSAKIVGQAKLSFRCLFEADVNGAIAEFEFPLKAESPENLTFTGKIDMGEERGGEADYKYTVKDGKLTGTVENAQVKVAITMERVYQKPPTLGAKAPEGAKVIFDGTSVDNFTKLDGKPAKWRLVEGGAMQVAPGSGNIVTKDKFLDQQIHVEFRTPYMPGMRGQARGNSGVYVGGNFEVQVLDSFGEPARDNEAGGIYKVAVPKDNAALPPGEWQVYDITYKAPKTDASGKVTTPGEFTLVYNGKTVHDKIAVNALTPGGVGGDIGKPGPLLLQDHGNPVEFRNIWIKPL
jgi:hypothetical protein